MSERINNDLQKILGEAVELDPPKSRIEKILYKILGYEIELDEPKSRTEKLLMQLAENPPGPGPTGNDTLKDLITDNLTTYTGDDIIWYRYNPFSENDTIEELNFPDLSPDSFFSVNYCHALEKVSIPTMKMEKAGNPISFTGCGSLQEIDMQPPEIIPENCFMGCSSLTENSFDFSKLEQVYDSGFSGCGSLTGIKLHYRGDNNGYNFICGPSAFADCSSLEKVILKSDTPTDETFYRAASGAVFGYCTSLEALVLDTNFVFDLTYTDPDTGETYTNEYLADCFSNTPIADGTGYIYVHESVKSAYENDPQWGQFSYRSIEDYPDILA